MPAEIDVAIIRAGIQESPYRAVTIGKASAILFAFIFHFRETSKRIGDTYEYGENLVAQ